MSSRWPSSFDSWLDPRLEIRDSPRHGRGTFAREPIAVGETVTVWAHRVLSARELTTAPPGTLSPRGREQWRWQPLDDQHAPDALLNHSCDSNLGMADEVALVARREIRQGEELTIDYALFSLDPDWVAVFACACGAASCRGTITARDWERAHLQARYAGYFHPSLAARIADHLAPGR